MTDTARPRFWLRRILVLLASLLAISIIAIWIAVHLAFDTGGGNVGAIEKTTTSKDGTVIAYEQGGSGPVVIVVSAALADRSGTTKLSKHLAEHYTVINYDRRGRGNSTDTQPYAVNREVEDIEALIDATGDAAYVFGSSSGSVLALEAASRLGPKVKKLYMYEPPFIIDDSHPSIPADFSKQIDELIVAGRRNDAVKLFFEQGMGIPKFAVSMMRWLMPGWSKMAGMAHTLHYDLTVLAGTQSGKSLPKERWSSASGPVLVVVGSKSEPFFHSGAKALVQILPNARYGVLEGRDHSAILMATKALADSAGGFFQDKK